MDTEHQRLTLQILIGSAWVDHTLSEPEVTYLKKVLDRYHLTQDTELQSLLQEPVLPQQTERWIVEFLRQTNQEERLKLLAAIGNLLIADDVVSEIEHDLLDEYHALMAKIPDDPNHITNLVRNIGSYVNKALQTLASLP
ncbi:TerB family tellurite resistance protein [Acaryochloris sp. 'Moss Beach']|uniref:TerB family tellurite resistance protein n=1 Tax=Acaryochloris sp. 'Moss Beach' TaxID=2740837 RepID=UPI001F2B0BDC|nr:TerB family tellurite resistance protein [Acaryochloris sp. 'Moss Beach']UJB71358.1 TerB family tellurite resistance protein [Acaryochloris sp. 'Moss Beach']